MFEGARPRKSYANLSDKIYRELRDRFHRGDVTPSERLIDVEIAEKLGVSRMPVREALLRLMHEGYVTGTTRGFMLPRLSSADIADIFEVRRCLEPRAAALAAQALDVVRMQTLRTALEDAERACETADVELLFQANVCFRRCWLMAVRNERLAAAIARFADHVQVVRLGTLAHPPTQKIVFAGMLKLYDAFASRDAIAAFDHMTSFIQTAEERFVTLSRSLEIEREGRRQSVNDETASAKRP